jgi:hypothetical protein
MAVATKPKTDDSTPATEGESTPVSVAPIEDPKVPDPDRVYLVFIEAVNHDDVPTTKTAEPTWIELGDISAPTKLEAWALAKARWPELVPTAPTSPDEAAKQEPVRAKLIPLRYAATIESRMEYVAPRAVTKGL